MSDKYKVSEAELEVMKIVWKEGEVTSSQIVEVLTKTTDWKPKTIQTLISRLVGKEALVATKIDKKSYMYKAAISEGEYKSYANNSFLKKLYDGSINMMISTFIKDKSISKEELNELRDLLNEEE